MTQQRWGSDVIAVTAPRHEAFRDTGDPRDMGSSRHEALISPATHAT